MGSRNRAYMDEIDDFQSPIIYKVAQYAYFSESEKKWIASSAFYKDEKEARADLAALTVRKLRYTEMQE
jgi:hypothetical protein